MGRRFGSAGLPGVRRDPDDASVVYKYDDPGALGDGTRAFCCGTVGGRWTKLDCAAGAEEHETDEVPCDQDQQGTPAGGGHVYGMVLAGKQVCDSSKASTVYCASDSCSCFSALLPSLVEAFAEQVLNEDSDTKDNVEMDAATRTYVSGMDCISS